jgi:hypothetical protein
MLAVCSSKLAATAAEPALYPGRCRTTRQHQQFRVETHIMKMMNDTVSEAAMHHAVLLPC